MVRSLFFRSWRNYGLLIRWTLAYPGQPFPVLGTILFPHTNGIVPPDTYAMLFTQHGTIMIFYAITPLLIGAFGNLCIPLMIGCRDMAFPILNMLSYWFFFISGVILLSALFTPLGAAAGGVDFLSDLVPYLWKSRSQRTLWYLAIFTVGISSILGAVNYITTIITLRAPGMGYFDMPLTIWGIWMTAILNAIFCSGSWCRLFTSYL